MQQYNKHANLALIMSLSFLASPYSRMFAADFLSRNFIETHSQLTGNCCYRNFRHPNSGFLANFSNRHFIGFSNYVSFNAINIFLALIDNILLTNFSSRNFIQANIGTIDNKFF